MTFAGIGCWRGGGSSGTIRRRLHCLSPPNYFPLSLSLSFYGFQEMIGKKFINDSFLKAEIKSSAEKKKKKEKEKSIRSAPTKTKAETPVKNGGCRSPEKRRADKWGQKREKNLYIFLEREERERGSGWCMLSFTETKMLKFCPQFSPTISRQVLFCLLSFLFYFYFSALLLFLSSFLFSFPNALFLHTLSLSLSLSLYEVDLFEVSSYYFTFTLLLF